VKSSDFPEFIDRYRVKDRLGKGGQGVVYLAHDPNLDIEVAIKVLSSDDPDFVERFKLDARVLARLNAPNIVRIFDFNPTYPYLVMEYCSGGDLNDLIKTRRPQPLRRIVELTRHICAALVVAHEQPDPILHRDLKPGNVLFDKHNAKVTDFGLAKVLGDQTSGLTMSRGMMGTAGYASPEQLQNAAKVDHRTDLWAVGVVLYELMTFRGPFESEEDDNVFQTAMRVVQSPPADPAYTIPRPIWEVIERSLQKTREKRFASARELTQALDAALASMPEAEQNAQYPPDRALSDLDRLARKVADFVDAGNLDEAREPLREMKRLSRDASVTRFWSRRLRTGDDTHPPVSGSTGGPAAALDASGSLASIDTLTTKYRFADARRKCGELLVADPNNELVHDRLIRITQDERELSQSIRQTMDEAAAAQSSNDLDRAVEVWSALDQKHRKHPDITAELATATRMRDERQRGKRREQAKAAVASREQSGDLAGALDVLDEYLETYPQDESLVPLREKIRATHTARSRETRVRDLRVKARKASTDNPEAALADWQAVLDELPTDEEAHRETERIRQTVVARTLARVVAEAEAKAAPYLSRYEYGPALAVWSELQQRYPGDAGIRNRISRLESAEREYRKRSLVESVGEQADQLETQNNDGRYDACSGLPKKVSEVVRNARVALRGDVDALTGAAEQLAATRSFADAELSKRLESLRLKLLRCLQEATELVPGESLTKAEEALNMAAGGVTRSLCKDDVLQTTGNPLSALDSAHTAIEAAIEGIATERRAMTDKVRKRSDTAFKAAEKAMQRLAASPVANEEGARNLADQLETLRERSASRSADVLEQVVVAATELSHRAISTRVRGEWDRLKRTRDALNETSALLAEGASGRLEERARACLEPLSGKSTVPVEQQDRALAELRLENETQRTALEEVKSGAAKVWQQAARRSEALGDTVSEELQSRIGASRKAGESLSGKDLDQEARRLAALVSRGEIESAWSAQSGTFHALEGSPEGGSALRGDIHELVVDYRGAVARGDSSRMRELGKRIAADRGTSGSDEVEVPRVGARMRRINKRLIPDVLQTYDDHVAAYEQASSNRRGDPSEAAFAAARSYRTLVQPPPAWRTWAPVAALLLVVSTAIVFAMPRSGPQTIRLVSPSGVVRLQDLQRDGSALAGPDSGDMNVGPEGTTWEVQNGDYTATTEHGAVLRFSVPGDETVFVPGRTVDVTSELADRLGLSELLSDDE